MRQTKLASIIETVLNISMGYVINTATAILLLPVFGVYLSIGLNMKISAAMTIVSVVRSYFVRRAFNKHQDAINAWSSKQLHSAHSTILYHATLL